MQMFIVSESPTLNMCPLHVSDEYTCRLWTIC